jgi:hypothetical protein
MEVPVQAYPSIHPGLAGLLQFDEQRLGIPIEVVRRPLQSAASRSVFRPIIELRIHCGGPPETFPVLLPDELLELTVPAHVTKEEQEVGFVDATGQFCPLAGISGNRVTVYFDLQALYSNPETIRRKPTNGTTPTGNPGNKVADLVLTQAFAIALGNIRRYDWKHEVKEFTDGAIAAWQASLDEVKSAYRENERSMEEKSWELRQLSGRNSELRQCIRLSERVTQKGLERKAREDHSNLVRLLGRGLRTIELRDGFLLAVTMPISITWQGILYELGRYVISVPLGDGRLTIKSRDGNSVEGYPHPHVASDGAPCLGNIAPTVAQLLGEAEYFQLVTTLLEFLRSYNVDNPYLRIERWDPDWQDDDDRFDNCYNDASLSDCATCSDDECHHLDGARRRCYEHTDTNDCIECAGCSRRRSAIDHCRERHDSHQCVACETECTYAGDVEACFETHAGENCATCSNEDCDHHKEN